MLVTQLCPTLCDPMDYSLPGSSVHETLQNFKNTGVGSHSLLQGIFPTQGSNPSLLHLQADSLPSEPPQKPQFHLYGYLKAVILVEALPKQMQFFSIAVF